MNLRTWMRSGAGPWLCVLATLLMAVGVAFSQDIATKGFDQRQSLR